MFSIAAIDFAQQEYTKEGMEKELKKTEGKKRIEGSFKASCLVLNSNFVQCVKRLFEFSCSAIPFAGWTNPEKVFICLFAFIRDIV